MTGAKALVRMADVAARRMRRLGLESSNISAHIFELVSTASMNKSYPWGVVDPKVEQLARFRKSKTGRSRGHNAARDFHRWVHRTGWQSLPSPNLWLEGPHSNSCKSQVREKENKVWTGQLPSDTYVQLVCKDHGDMPPLLPWWLRPILWRQVDPYVSRILG